MNKLLQLKKRGSALVMAMCVVVILLAMGMGLLRLGLNSRIYSIRDASDITARCAADAGMAKALYEMNKKLQVQPWNDSELPLGTNINLSNCDAAFSYSVTSGSSGYYSIQSTGTSDQAVRTVSCTLQLEGLFEAAIFTKEYLYMKSGGTVDWYNFDADDGSLKIGTNSTLADSIVLQNNSTVNGDVVVGLGGNPDDVIRDNGATVTGSTTTLTQIVEMPSVTVPEVLETSPSLGTIKLSTTISSSGKYDNINLQGGKTVMIEGDVTLYIIGDISLGNSAELQIVEGASLTLYLGGDFEGKNSSCVNNLTQDPQQLIIYGLDSCESMVFKNGSDFYGSIYAPNAEVVMHNSSDVYGAVTAESFEQKNSATFYYDASLRDVSTSDELVRFVISNWSE
jgi:choice-of-anchor A domain-containing protein